MPRIRLKIELTSKTDIQLRQGIKRGGAGEMVSRAFANASVITQDVANMLVAKFNASDVARSLRGQGSVDLPAHFGLDDSTANALVDGMANIIRTSVKLSGSSVGGSASLNIRAVETDWNKYLALPGAQHIAQPSNISIPVVRWMLIDPTIDIGQAAFDIVFKGENSKFDVRINNVSKSGRAIMVSLKSLGGSGGYVLPAIVAGQNGQNFIEYTLGQPGVALAAANIAMKRIR